MSERNGDKARFQIYRKRRIHRRMRMRELLKVLARKTVAGSAAPRKSPDA